MVLLNNIEMFRNSLQYACLKAVSTCDQNKLLLNNFINLNLNQAIKIAFATIMLDIMGVNCQDIHKLQPVAFFKEICHNVYIYTKDGILFPDVLKNADVLEWAICLCNCCREEFLKQKQQDEEEDKRARESALNMIKAGPLDGVKVSFK